MLRRFLMGATIVAALVRPPMALGADDDKPKPEQIAAIADRLAPSLVRVEIVAKYDKGEAPSAGSDRWGDYFRAVQAGAGENSVFAPEDNWEQCIKEERPSERGGYLVSPTRVYTFDPGLHPRFIKSITVRFGNESVSAKPAAYSKDRGGCFLELEHPLAGATPLTFDATKEGPYLTFSYGKNNAMWMTRIGGMRGGLIVGSDGRKIAASPGLALVTDKLGTPVGLTGATDLPINGDWKGSPDKWPLVSADDLDRIDGRVESESARQIVRVRMNFRSPRNEGQNNPYDYMSRMRGGAEDAEITNTEWNGIGVVMDNRTLLVLANFKAKTTARLERIRAYMPDGKEVAAKFDGTLKDWGGIVARFEQPVPQAARLSGAPITSHEDKLLVCAQVAVRGETRTAYFVREHINAFYTGFQGKTYPRVAAQSGEGAMRFNPYGGGGEGSSYRHFLYTLDGELVCLPIDRREKVTVQQDQYSYYNAMMGQGSMVPVALLAETLSQGQSAYDVDNCPVSESEENRIAWIGAELQGMTPDLARANNCIEQTNNGTSGGIVTYLYEDSPATKAGLKIGDILLRLHIEGQPKPLEVSVDDHGMGGMMDQFWQYLDRMPDEYMDRMPKPWGSVENSLTRALTEIGFGTNFTADVLRDGKVENVAMKVTQGPAYYDSAARFKSEEMGVTVRDITYEVRRYFQMKPDESGVIISKIERGSRASVAGLKPMETIRSVNDKPITSVKEFENAIKAGGEFKLAIKRMTQGRTVKVKCEPAGTGPSKSEGAKKGGDMDQNDDPGGNP
jgi:hypothetical protein